MDLPVLSIVPVVLAVVGTVLCPVTLDAVGDEVLKAPGVVQVQIPTSRVDAGFCLFFFSGRFLDTTLFKIQTK